MLTIDPMTAEEIEISPAVDAEIPWCAHVMATTEPWITLRRDYDACLARCRKPEFDVLVAHRGGKSAGFMLLHPTGVAGSPYVASLAVAADARSAGVGSALL